MSLSCPACRSALAADARFCPSCGTAAPASGSTTPVDPVREILKVALGRQYEIQRLLGRGGMGAVYLATEAALEREVAIKVLPPDRGATQESRDRFRREARTAAKLSHPNIVPLYTFGDVEGTLYFVMGYVKGESLATRLKREGRLEMEAARRILIEIAEALDYAHKVGVIHRDIKPDNVLLEEGTGRALLTDFGVAKALGSGQTMTEAGSVLGTPHYMSPEQAQGKSDIDHRSDLYSLGVMGYAMLAGRLPFEGTTPGEVMVQHITKDAPTLDSLLPGLPVEITSALARCLTKDRERRFRDGAGLRAALSATDVDEAHEEFEDLPGLLRMVLGACVVLLLIAAWWLGGGDISDPFPVLPLIVGAIAVLLSLAIVVRYSQLRRVGFESSRIMKEVFKQPESWMGWYPRRFRGRWDVWDRLPRQLKWARGLLAATVLSMVLLVLPFIVFSLAWTSHIKRTGQRPYGSSAQAPPALPLFVVLPGIVVGLGLMFRWRGHARRSGLDERTAGRTLDTPTTRRSFWSRPEIAVLLLPETDARRANPTAAPDSPAGLAAAVSSIARALPESSRSLGSQADAAARELAGMIASLDEQIAALSSGADPAEAERLTAKIAGLGTPRTGEGEAKAQMRELLEKQLALLRGVDSRLEGLRARRARHVDLLRALWQQTQALASAAGDPARVSGASQRIHALCEEISVHEDASLATRDLDPAITESPTLER